MYRCLGKKTVRTIFRGLAKIQRTATLTSAPSGENKVTILKPRTVLGQNYQIGKLLQAGNWKNRRSFFASLQSFPVQTEFRIESTLCLDQPFPGRTPHHSPRVVLYLPANSQPLGIRRAETLSLLPVQYSLQALLLASPSLIVTLLSSPITNLTLNGFRNHSNKILLKILKYYVKLVENILYINYTGNFILLLTFN